MKKPNNSATLKIVVTAFLIAAALLAAAYTHASKSNASTCAEDMPCWNCETMGNKVCGPIVDDAWIPCAQAVKDGYYTPELFSQCIDDYRDAR